MLLAYAKIVALDDVLATDAPDDPVMETLLRGYFPPKMHKTYAEEIEGHQLRREIIGTVLVNAMINRGGPTFINQAMERTGAGIDMLARAFLTAWKAYGLEDLSASIDALDAEIAGDVQLELYAILRDCVLGQTVWFARNADYTDGIAPVATGYGRAVEALSPKLDALAPDFLVRRMASEAAAFEEQGVPSKLATRLGQMAVLALVPDIELAARTADAKLEETAQAFFAITKTFQIGRIVQASREVALPDYYDSLALDRAMQGSAPGTAGDHRRYHAVRQGCGCVARCASGRGGPNDGATQTHRRRRHDVRIPPYGRRQRIGRSGTGVNCRAGIADTATIVPGRYPV